MTPTQGPHDERRFLRSSRFAIVSATSSSAAVLAAATATMANGNYTIRLALGVGLIFLTGVLFLLAGFARMGNITDFIAKPVLRGFTFGLALVIVIRQWADIVGVHPPHGDILWFGAELFPTPCRA